MRTFLKALTLLVLAALLIVPLMAQEVPVDEAPVVTEAPVVEVPVVVSPVVAPAADSMQVNLISIIIGLLTAFSAGGIMGIAGLALFVDRINKNTPMVTAFEQLGASFPPETKEILLGISRALEKLGQLGGEVFDGVPVAEKKPPQIEAQNIPDEMKMAMRNSGINQT